MLAKLRLTAAAAIVALASPALATNGMRMIGFGPVQNSMGGVSVGAALDATAVVTNPAGITRLAPRLDLAGTAFAPAPEYDAQWQMPGMPSAAPAGQESDRPVDYMPTIAAVYRVQDRLTLGVAALGTAGMGVEYPGGGAALYTMRNYTNYMAMRVAPAAGYRVTDALSIGVALNFQYALLGYEAAGMPERDSDGAMGFGATVGVTFEATESLTLAAAYESRSWFQEFEFDIPAHTTPFGQPVPGGTEKMDFDQPMIATIGASIRPAEWLLLAADVQWIDWSSTNGEDLPEYTTAQPETGYMPWNLDWSDQWVFKVGGQAMVPGVKGLALRAGYDYGAMPLDADRAFENIAFPAIAEHHFTLGGGYERGSWTVNVAAVYSPEAKLSGSNPAQGIVAYQDRMSQLLFDVGMSYRF